MVIVDLNFTVLFTITNNSHILSKTYSLYRMFLYQGVVFSFFYKRRSPLIFPDISFRFIT
jgi:hypothetical protein